MGYESRLATARSFLNRESANLNKYHGGMPVGFLAAIVEHESGGNMNSPGDASLGEVGYFQIPTETADNLGVPRDIRYDPEGNIFLGCLEYQTYAARLSAKYSFITNGSDDQWKFARLYFAVGVGALYNLLNKFGGGSYEDFVNASQSLTSGKTLDRIQDILVQWQIGQDLTPFSSSGPPEQIPPYVPYTTPNGVVLAAPSQQYLKYIMVAFGIYVVYQLLA